MGDVIMIENDNEPSPGQTQKTKFENPEIM